MTLQTSGSVRPILLYIQFGILQLLKKEIEQQGEEDIPTVCDKLKDKWQLPDGEYGLFVRCFYCIVHRRSFIYGHSIEPSPYFLPSAT